MSRSGYTGISLPDELAAELDAVGIKAFRVKVRRPSILRFLIKFYLEHRGES